MKHSCIIRAILGSAVLPLLLSQCVLSNTDPGFGALLRTVETHPSPTAIVGMWHRRDTRAVPGGSTMSILFQSNGTMVIKGRSKMLGANVASALEQHRYYYAGGGIWRMSDDSRAKFALSQGHMLFVYPIPEMYDVLQFVFERPQ